jgi:modulator of FtsH protease HflC
MRNLQSLVIVIAVGIVVAATVLLSSVYILDETKQSFVTQFGRPVGEPIDQPGLKFKTPFIQKVHFFEKRFLEWDGHPNQVTTRDKRFIFIDTYARWRISNALLFYESVRDELGAQARLNDVLDGATRNEVARHDLVDLVRSVERVAAIDASDLGLEELTEQPGQAPLDLDISTLQAFRIGRGEIAENILKSAKPQLENWGIELLDIRFKRINYEDTVRRAIFERMSSERQRIAEELRSRGAGKAAEVLGEREFELRKIESEAFREVQTITGRADAEAAALYASAYNQSPASQAFYRFLKTMETYEETLNEKDTLILSTTGDFYRYLRGASPYPLPPSLEPTIDPAPGPGTVRVDPPEPNR